MDSKEYSTTKYKIAYSLKELSLLTSISKSQIYLEIKNNRLQVFKCGKRTLTTNESVTEWIEKLSNTKN
jgi:hypothetical protein